MLAHPPETASAQLFFALEGLWPESKEGSLQVDPGHGPPQFRSRADLRRIAIYLEATRGKRAEEALRRLMEISERQQSRMGQDLHEGLSQHLAGVALLCNVLATKLRNEAHPESEAAAALTRLMAETVVTTREMARGFYPVELESGGLVTALEAFAHQTRERFQVECEVRQVGPPLHLDDHTEIHLYRIVQESIGNAIEHGHAQHILIETQAKAGVQTLSITDDGVGFAAPSANSPGLGLYLMDYRARLMGAQIEVQKPEAGGCKVICRLNRRRGAPLSPGPALL